MIKPEQIPSEVVRQFITANNGCECDECISVAIAAAINAWPGFKEAWFLPQGKVYMLPAPWENPKPQEKKDD